MIYDNFLGLDLIMIGTGLIYIAALLSLWSALKYSISMIRKLQEKRAEKKKLKKVARETT